MSVQEKEMGALIDALPKDGFVIHDMMFSVKDVIQCLFLASRTMYTTFESGEATSYAITINTTDKWIMATPMVTNDKFNKKSNANGTNPPARELNTYTQYDEDHIIMLMSKGFVVDNFIMKESYHDFLLQEGEYHVMINASDIESLTVKNPTLE